MIQTQLAWTTHHPGSFILYGQTHTFRRAFKAGFHYWWSRSPSKWNHRSTYDLVKMKYWSHKCNKDQSVSISSNFAYMALLLLFRLWSRENQIVGVRSRSGRTKSITKCGNVHCDWFVLLLLLSTPTTWFSLDHKRNVSNWVVSGIGTLFSLDHKLHASDYGSNSDSIINENQPLWFFLTGE